MAYDSIYDGETYGQRAARQRAEEESTLTLPVYAHRRFPKSQDFISTLGIVPSTILTDSIDINGCTILAIGSDGRYLVTEDRAGERCMVSRYYAWPTMTVGLHVLDLLFHEGWTQGA